MEEERIYRTASRRHRKIRKFRIISIIVIFILAVILFIFLCQSDNITVSGNSNCSAEMIKSDIISGRAQENTLYQRLYAIFGKKKEIRYLKKYDIKYAGINRMIIEVVEKPPVAYVEMGESFVLFAEDGLVMQIENERPENLMRIEGMELEGAKLYEVIPAKNEEVFKMVKNFVSVINRTELVPDRVVLDEKDEIQLFFAGITVLLGDDDSLEDKMAKLIAIMPNIEGKTGILYMQDVDENTDEVSFVKTKPLNNQ